MVKRKSKHELVIMRKAGQIVADVHKAMREAIKPGISTYELDKIAYDVIHKNGAIPSFLNYQAHFADTPYPATICASINDQVVHGIPSKDVILKEGDIISIDVGATYHGMVGDSAWTYPVGEISNELKMLLDITEKALYSAIDKARDGHMLIEVSGAVEDVAKSAGLGTEMIFFLVNIWLSVEDHSGYDLPWSTHRLVPFGWYGGAPHHDLHHLKFKSNYAPYFTHWDGGDGDPSHHRPGERGNVQHSSI